MSKHGGPINNLIICGGRVIDPEQSTDRIDDVAIADGLIADARSGASDGSAVIDAGGLIVCPGLIDMHVHLREPGGEHKETIATGTAAAAAGGFTAVACMPNTKPPIDNVETIRQVRETAAKGVGCRVYPIAAITRGRKGDQVVEMDILKEAGAVAFSDDGDGVEDDEVMRTAFERARSLDAVLIQHCEFKSLSAGGVMHKGTVSQRLGLPGIDPSAEEAMIERDIDLVRSIGGRYHVAHISTAGAVESVRHAKREGLPVTAEVCVHHLILTDEACSEQDPNMKMHPPLRSREDVDACIAGVCDGTIACIVTDHAPHAESEKAVGFRDAPFGIVGLETALALCATNLVKAGRLEWIELIRLMSCSPARVLGVSGGRLTTGSPADVTLIDPEQSRQIDAGQFLTKSRNTPFGGWEVSGRAVATIVGGRLTHCDRAYRGRFQP